MTVERKLGGRRVEVKKWKPRVKAEARRIGRELGDGRRRGSGAEVRGGES